MKVIPKFDVTNEIFKILKKSANYLSNPVNTDLFSYYSNRAKEYEKIYSRPERQNDLRQATQILQEILRDKDVFEIACGTGYWTKYLAETAKNIVATDINSTVLDVARSKS